MSQDSVTQWLDGLKVGSDTAAEKIWTGYFDQLLRLARSKLRTAPRRVADEEDVAISAFESFCQGVAVGRFPRLDDRHDLWRLLLTITERKAYRQVDREQRLKRGGGLVRGHSVFLKASDTQPGTLEDQVTSGEPTPEFAAELVEQFDHLLSVLDDDVLRKIALMKLEGYTNDEVASRLGFASRSVTRKLEVIRRVWSEDDGSEEEGT